jgi:hypothetical protein
MLDRWHNRVKIPAIHDRDLETVLRDLGILDKVTSGEILCSICGTPLTLDTIECLYMQGADLKLCCRQIECCKLVLNSTESTKGK